MTGKGSVGQHLRVPLREQDFIQYFINKLNFKKKIMDKKDLKMYEAPSLEVVELEQEGFLCASPAGGGSEDIDPENIDPGFGS